MWLNLPVAYIASSEQHKITTEQLGVSGTAGLHDSGLAGDDDGLGSGTEVQFLQDAGDMGFRFPLTTSFTAISTLDRPLAMSLSTSSSRAVSSAISAGIGLRVGLRANSSISRPGDGWGEHRAADGRDADGGYQLLLGCVGVEHRDQRADSAHVRSSPRAGGSD